MTMKSTKPYLFEAMYRWMVDSNCTPLVRARTDILGVVVPEGYAKDGEIILDISADSIEKLSITEHIITFNASFGGKICSIRLPMTCVLAIHAAENQMGIEFHDEEIGEDEGEPQTGEADGKPDLRIL